MKPAVPKALNGVAATLRGRVLAELESPFTRSALGTGARVLDMVAQEFDRAAARLVAENAAMRDIFAAAESVVTEPRLRERLAREVGSQRPVDLHVSALQTENDRLRALLIDLHAHAESINSVEARALIDLIWEELRRSVERRRFAPLVIVPPRAS